MQKIINYGSYAISLAVLFSIIVAANKIPITYTPYQVLVFELKANEGYKSWWYKDGVVRGRTAHSIGFGWNDQGNRRRHEIAKYTKDGKVTVNEATEITVNEIGKYGKFHSDRWKNLALQLYAYNCGPNKATPSNLGKCCGGRKGCGNRNPQIKKSHNRRRKFELCLWRHDFQAINNITDENKEICKRRKYYEKK